MLIGAAKLFGTASGKPNASPGSRNVLPPTAAVMVRGVLRLNWNSGDSVCERWCGGKTYGRLHRSVMCRGRPIQSTVWQLVRIFWRIRWISLRGEARVFVGDITYLRVQSGGFCYLACLQDKFTRRIVGWKVATRMTAQLVIDVFLQARRGGLIGRNAIIHTDQGSQYAAVEYRRLLYTGGFRQSMSRKGNCYDNAQAESFFSRFKAELVENGIFESIEDARSEVFSYIEGYYNRVRLHSSLGYKSPLEFEKQSEIKNIRSSESFVCGKTWPSHCIN